MLHDANMDELDDLIDDAASWWRDVAAGSALAVFAVAAVVMFLR